MDKVKDPAAISASIQRYKALIACLPSSSKYLLCYVLDLLNVFHRHAAQNLMPAANLAVVFQPGLIRPPDTPLGKSTPFPSTNEPTGQSSEEALNPPNFPNLSRVSSNPLVSKAMTASSTNDSRTNTSELQRRQDEIKINQEVLEFLINHQDHFVALPEFSSSSETSPVSPTSGSGQSRGSSNAQAAAPPRSKQNLPPTSPQLQQPQQPQRPQQLQQLQQRQPVTTVASPPATKPQQTGRQPTAVAAPLPIKASQVPIVVANSTASSLVQQAARPSKPAEETTSQLPNAPRQAQPQRPPKSPSRTGSPAPIRGHESRPNTGRSSPSSRPPEPLLQPKPQSPLSVSPTSSSPFYTSAQPQIRPSGPPPPGRSSPVQVLGQLQQGVVKPPRPGKIAEKQEKPKGGDKQKAEDRKPRKLKKGRTPTSSSGTNTPLSPPMVAWDPSSPVPPIQYHHSGPHHSASTPPAHIYDEDTPLSQGMAAAGPGVKRSRTLPSPGDKASSGRLVGVFPFIGFAERNIANPS